MSDIQIIAFVFFVLFSELGVLLMPVALAATAVAAAANVQFQPVAV